jgi:hypothetical protein
MPLQKAVQNVEVPSTRNERHHQNNTRTFVDPERVMSPKPDHEVLRLVEKLLEQTMARQHPERLAYYALTHAVLEVKNGRPRPVPG